MSRLKSIVRLLTNDNFKQPTHHTIYFTPNYGNPYDLLKDFSAYNWILISDEYIHKISSVNQRKKLHEFFSELGVSDFLFPINNLTYEQFDSLIRIQSISMNKKLFFALQQNYSKFHDHEKFLQHIKDSIWIPTIQITYSYNEQIDRIESSKIRQLEKPSHVYIKTKQIEQLFGSHIQYIDIDANNLNSSFSNDIGLIEKITPANVTNMLLDWCRNSIFYTSISHMQYIYEYIYENMSVTELKEFINKNSIFFVSVSSSSPSDRRNIIRGTFVSRTDVCWCDSTTLFSKYSLSSGCRHRYFLEPYYAEQKSIFLDTFDIPLNPTIDEYIDLLGKTILSTSSNYIFYF